MLAVTVIFSSTLGACAKIDDGGNENFTTVKIPFPESIEERDSWRAYAQYKDTGEIITLSTYYDGCIWATVPAENKGRELGVIVPKELEFTDFDETSNYYDIEWLSRTGVIKGNERGEAEPERYITRAEAVAIIMRFMGLESLADDETAVFSDVKKSDWFFSDVAAAYNCNIITGDSDTAFSPNRSVTREEVTVMVARALQYADLRCPADGVRVFADKDDISSWAKSAYEYLGITNSYDFSENPDDIENPISHIKPQEEATRLFIAKVLNNVQGLCQLYPSEAAIAYGFDKEMPVIDGSTSTYPFTEAVYNALFHSGMTHSQFPKKHSKSHASYERLINGEVDMLFASVYPASDILKLAEEKGVELELIPIAYDAMVFFTNADNPISGLSQEQITDIYVNNAYGNWAELGGSDALLYAYCRNNDSGSHAQMEKHFLHGGEIHPEVQKETSDTMLNVLTDVMKAQTDSPFGYGLGYSIFYYFNNMDLFYNTKTKLKLLEIDGIMPTDETIADSSYPLSNNTYIVLRKDTPSDAPARKMAEFMLSEAGQECVESAGFGKLSK